MHLVEILKADSSAFCNASTNFQFFLRNSYECNLVFIHTINTHLQCNHWINIENYYQFSGGKTKAHLNGAEKKRKREELKGVIRGQDKDVTSI